MGKWVMNEKGHLVNLDLMHGIIYEPDDSHAWKVTCLGVEWGTTLIESLSKQEAIDFIKELHEKLD